MYDLMYYLPGPIEIVVLLAIIGIIAAVFVKTRQKEESSPRPHRDYSTSSPSGKENRVERVRLVGGIAGALGTRPRRALEEKMAEVNAEGWRVIQVIPDDTGNLLIYILRWVILLATLFIYTPANGYFLILEREVNPSAVKLSAKEQEILEQIKREEK